MRFRRFQLSFCFCFLGAVSLTLSLCSSSAAAQIKDRVVAYVDNTAITLSELEEKYAETIRTAPSVTREEVLGTMINRILMIREAIKIRLQSESEEALLKDYIDLKIRAFIRIGDDEMRSFYDLHSLDFAGKSLDEVRDDIEDILTEQKLNERLREHIEELRNNACVKMQLIQQNRE